MQNLVYVAQHMNMVRYSRMGEVIKQAELIINVSGSIYRVGNPKLFWFFQ